MNKRTQQLMAEIRARLEEPSLVKIAEDVARAERIAARALELARKGAHFTIDPAASMVRHRDGRREVIL